MRKPVQPPAPKTKPTSRRRQGDEAEELAAQILSQRGYQILQRNYTCRGGELDIIAEKEGVLCFVEVRSLSSTRFGLPQDTIRYPKQQRMITAAKHYLQALHHTPPCRFDVVAIYPTPSGTQLDLIEGAFSL